MEHKKIDFTQAINYKALETAMKDKNKRKELERIFAKIKY